MKNEITIGQVYADVEDGGISWGDDTSESEMIIKCPACQCNTSAGYGMPVVDIQEFRCLKCEVTFEIIDADPCGNMTLRVAGLPEIII